MHLCSAVVVSQTNRISQTIAATTLIRLTRHRQRVLPPIKLVSSGIHVGRWDDYARPGMFYLLRKRAWQIRISAPSLGLEFWTLERLPIEYLYVISVVYVLQIHVCDMLPCMKRVNPPRMPNWQLEGVVGGTWEPSSTSEFCS